MLDSDLPHLPADLDQFWQSTLEKTRARPLDAICEKMPEKVPYFVYRITYKSLGDVPIRAILAQPIFQTPAGSAVRRLPAVITCPGYGGWEMGAMLSECQRGYIILQVYPRSQGESSTLWRVEDKAFQAWVNHGRGNPEGFYYQGAIMDLSRGLDYLLTRPDVDPDRIGIMGASQAGMLSLGSAGVDSRFRAVASHVPYLCDFRRSTAFVDNELSKDPQFARTWDYFDPVHLAHRIQSPTLISAGGKDGLCPWQTIHRVFNQLPGTKALAHYPDLPHTACPDFYAQSWEWMRRNL